MNPLIQKVQELLRGLVADPATNRHRPDSKDRRIAELVRLRKDFPHCTCPAADGRTFHRLAGDLLICRLQLREFLLKICLVSDCRHVRMMHRVVADHVSFPLPCAE